jgi:hypothetical protein
MKVRNEPEFVLGRPFHPSLMFVGKIRVPPYREQLKGASPSQALALLTNIRLG